MRCHSNNRPATAAQLFRVAAIAALLGTAACGDHKPSGQAVATVNGQDITTSELNLELATAGLTGAAREQAKGQALQALIDRKLLVQAAEKDKLDKDAEFVLAERRMHEILLAQKAVQSAAASARRPQTESDINAYLDKHSNLGSGRRILVLEQLRFATPTSQARMDALRPAKSLDQLAQILQSQGVPSERGRAELDTGLMDDDAMKQLSKVAPGEPLVVMRGQQAVANVVIGERPAPTSGAAAADVAKQRIAAEQVSAAMKQRQESLRRDATIVYAEGYAPKASPAAKPGQ